VLGKHSEKIQRVVGERPNISLALCSEFLLSVKKKLIEGPEKFTFFLVKLLKFQPSLVNFEV